MSSLIGRSWEDDSQSSLADVEEKLTNTTSHTNNDQITDNTNIVQHCTLSNINSKHYNTPVKPFEYRGTKGKFADLVDDILHPNNISHTIHNSKTSVKLTDNFDLYPRNVTLSTESLITKLKDQHFHQPSLRCNSESDLSGHSNNNIISSRNKNLILSTLNAFSNYHQSHREPIESRQYHQFCPQRLHNSNEHLFAYLTSMNSRNKRKSSPSNFTLLTHQTLNHSKRLDVQNSFNRSHDVHDKTHYECSKCLRIRIIDKSDEDENLDHYKEWIVSGPQALTRQNYLNRSSLSTNSSSNLDFSEKGIGRGSKVISGYEEAKICPQRNTGDMRKLRSNSIPVEQQNRKLLNKNDFGFIKELDNEEDDLEENEAILLLGRRNQLKNSTSSISHHSRRMSSLMPSENSIHQQFPIKPFQDRDDVPARIRRASMMFNSTLLNTESLTGEKIIPIEDEAPIPTNKLKNSNNALLRKYHPDKDGRASDHSPIRFRRKSKVTKVEIENIRASTSRKSQTKSTAVVRHQLGRRRKLIERRRHLADFSLFFALFGIFVMFIDAELVFTQIIKTEEIYSNSLRGLISFSTIILIILICFYHAYDIMVFSCDDCIEDWRIAVDYWRVLQIIFEIIICFFHPIPGFHWHNPLPGDFAHNHTDRSGIYRVRCEPDTIELPMIRDYNIYLLLSLPMISRLYLVLRVLLLHGKMFNDAGSRSIGAMNKISFDVRFVLKTLMTVFPGTVLFIFILTCWVVMTWTLRACERRQIDQPDLFKCGWLIAVTFLSIGYGDIVPVTQCGKIIAISCGLMGSACTALVVAVFSRKLELSKAEKYVIHFMTSNKLSKNMKYYAANVLRETWLIYKHTKLTKNVNPGKIRLHQRKFLRAIHGLRQMKVMQRELQDESNSLVDFTKLQANVFETVVAVSLRQDCIQRRMENLENILQNIRDLVQKKLN